MLEWLPFPSPGDPPEPGVKPGSPALQADSLPSEPLRDVNSEDSKQLDETPVF